MKNSQIHIPLGIDRFASRTALSVVFLLNIVMLFCGRAAEDITLAENGKAPFPIVVSTGSSETNRANAAVLAEYLKKMTGAEFAIEEGDGSRGIVLGVQADFSGLPKRFDLDPQDPLRSEEYALYSHPAGFLLVGATDLGVQNAMWDFLHRKGYRQYFPGPEWEIIPSVSKLAAGYDEVQKPSFYMRKYFYNGGTSQERKALFDDWQRKNRMQSGQDVNTGHSWNGIFERNRDAFLANPELRAMVNGERILNEKNPKFNLVNPELRKLVVEDRLSEMRKNPEQKSISIDPSDGGSFDESEEGKAFGSISDQVVLLANDVAEAIDKEFPGTPVGMYSYGFYSDPPSIRVHPNVVVQITTAFRQTPMTLQEQIQAWAKQGAAVGIRDYISVPVWDFDLPSRARLSWLSKYINNWRNYHAWGVRYYKAECSDNWGIMGLVYYTGSRVLWDVNDPVTAESVTEEFLQNCFGPVISEMSEFYNLMAKKPILGPDLINRLYSSLQAAMDKNPPQAVMTRLHSLACYVRYVELYSRYIELEGEDRRDAFKVLATHMFRSDERRMTATRGVMRMIARESGLQWPKELILTFRRGAPPWALDEPPYTVEEIEAFVKEGIKNNERLSFETISYSDDLVPVTPLLKEKDYPVGEFGISDKRSLFYTWADSEGSEWKIKLTNVRGPKPNAREPKPRLLRVELWSAADLLGEAPVDQQIIEVPMGETGEVVLKSANKGLHWVSLVGPEVGDILDLDETKLWTVTSVPDAPVQMMPRMVPRGAFYFYVPEGTRILGMWIDGEGVLKDPDGNVVKELVKQDSYLKFDVPENMDGKFWKFDNWRGRPLLLTAPSYFASTPELLLLPREVVEADALKQD
jgi:hypothetical protein